MSKFVDVIDHTLPKAMNIEYNSDFVAKGQPRSSRSFCNIAGSQLNTLHNTRPSPQAFFVPLPLSQHFLLPHS